MPTMDTIWRPAPTGLTGYRVEVDGWAAGAPGQDAETVNAVIDAQGTIWVLQKFEGWAEAPPPRTSLVTRPGEHGAYDGPAYLPPRALTLEGTALAQSRTAAWRARDIISSVCGDPALGLSTLVVTQANYLTRRMAVRRSGDTKTMPISAYAFRWSMILVAPDPRRYDDTLSTDSVGLPQPPSGGLVFPLVFPLTFGGTLSGGQMSLTNAGTMATWPTWVVGGPLDGPRITNLDTGQELVFDPDLTLDGSDLIIDTDAKTVRLGAQSARDRLLVAQWFPLRPGTTAVRFSAAAGSDPAASLIAQWRSAWT